MHISNQHAGLHDEQGQSVIARNSTNHTSCKGAKGHDKHTRAKRNPSRIANRQIRFTRQKDRVSLAIPTGFGHWNFNRQWEHRNGGRTLRPAHQSNDETCLLIPSSLAL